MKDCWRKLGRQAMFWSCLAGRLVGGPESFAGENGEGNPERVVPLDRLVGLSHGKIEFMHYGQVVPASWVRAYRDFVLDRLMENDTFVQELQEFFNEENWQDHLFRTTEIDALGQERASFCLQDMTVYGNIWNRIFDAHLPLPFEVFFFDDERARQPGMEWAVQKHALSWITEGICGALSADARQVLLDVKAYLANE